ncbi:MAG: hypothetical protein R3F59_36745 [Myxococcota bacterium]
MRVDDLLLQLDLEQRAPLGRLEAEVTGAIRREQLLVLQLDGTFPTLDPRATRWPLRLVEERATGAVAEWLVIACGAPRPVPPALDPEVAQAAIRALGRSLSEGGVLPLAAELVQLGLAAGGSVEAPILALPVPPARIWLAAAAGLGRWLAGVAEDFEAVEALALVSGAGAVDVLFAR